MGVDAKAVCSGVRKREVVRARKPLSRVAVLRMGYSGAEVSHFLGLATSTVNRLVSQKELPECKKYNSTFRVVVIIWNTIQFCGLPAVGSQGARIQESEFMRKPFKIK